MYLKKPKHANKLLFRFHPLKSLESCISVGEKTSWRFWFRAVSSWEGFFQEEAHQYSSRCGWIRCQNTALFFLPPHPQTLIPALLSIPAEVDSKPKSLDIANRDAGPEPWAACGGDHVLNKHFWASTLSQRSALGTNWLSPWLWN